MKSKYLLLNQLTSLLSNALLFEKYINYLAGFDPSHKCRREEIESVSNLLADTDLSLFGASGFLFGYSIPQLDKEFDLLKITEEITINVELKSEETSEEKRLKQLLQNRHYLKMIGKKARLFSYISSSHKLYELIDDKLIAVSFSVLKDLCEKPFLEPDLDSFFSPNNILISPLNEPEKFLKGEYLLTEHQEDIKRRLFKRMELNESFFFGITGSPGTGKTLLLYDIAITLAKNHSVIVIHGGRLCAGHKELAKHTKNLEIIAPKELRFREIKLVDYVLIDEAHRIWPSQMDKIQRWFIKAKTVCIFSYDPKQRLAHSEFNWRTAETIEALCGINQVKLTNKIRTNKELASFVESLFDLRKKKPYSYKNVSIFYEPIKKKAVTLAKSLEAFGYKYIAITPSIIDPSLDYQDGELNSHRVIGQEFNKVCMVMDENFLYVGGELKSQKHPNPDYISSQLLYQGLTRARTAIALVLTNIQLFEKILGIVSENV